jgi:hypothetical protein
VLSEKYDWVEHMELALVKSICYQQLKIARSNVRASETASSVHNVCR